MVSCPALKQLSDSAWAWVHDRPDWGYGNSGVVASDHQGVLVDTQFTLAATRDLLDAVAAELPGTTVSTVVNSHANGDHTWGNQLLPGAEIITSASSAQHACHEMGPGQLTALCRAGGSTPAGSYIERHFGQFNFAGITVTGPTRTFAGRLEVEVGHTLAELIDLGAGHSAGDVAVHIPEDGVVFAGDALFNGSHMVVWSQSLSACVMACEQLLATGADTFVPGHGPVIGRSGVADIRDRLAAVAEAADRHAQAGVPLADAARLVMADHAGNWAHPERLFTQTAAAYAEAGVPGLPSGTLALVEGMAVLASA
ncbi:MBL fold metallo-hydrolase [Streptomyces sp. NBC_01304]|uniref:MBL fold metallo-hydrolase n=1 Tax=Streptomyces sp. NBC_01304 TaxID=2903818 RepID=UPI002E144BEA|nr:MBL fold metallo-hydrolase [Streptomyces sp. NBC_01304]